MRLKRVLIFVLCLVMVVTIFSSLSSAQVRRPLRWLGHGYSDGYNRCNPGPISDYYNPYSAHNSRLVSQPPYGMESVPKEGSIQRGIPFSVYASPKSRDKNESFKTGPGQEIDNSFVPYEPNLNGTESIPEAGTKPGIDSNKNTNFVPQLPDQAEDVKSTSQSVFSNSGFRVQPKVNHENLFDPFVSD